MILLFNSSVLFPCLCWWTKWLYKTTTILLTTGLNVLILIRNINLNNYISKLKVALKFLVPNIKLVDIDPTNLAYTNSNIDTLHKKMYPPTFLHHSCLSTCAEIGMRHAFWIKNVNNHYRYTLLSKLQRNAHANNRSSKIILEFFLESLIKRVGQLICYDLFW